MDSNACRLQGSFKKSELMLCRPFIEDCFQGAFVRLASSQFGETRIVSEDGAA